ncbi:MAG: hypothetical protein KDE27_03465 [Planctomycetes bacterium]|nr:hypothetical protein [Planctomycetota bacterium]
MKRSATSRVTTWLAVAVGAHCAFGALRVPHAVIWKRWCEVADYRAEGGVAWRLESAALDGREAIETLLRTTGEDAVVLLRGDPKGAIEYAAPLLWPRLCCVAGAVPAEAETYLGRPIAARVLVGEGRALRLEPR